MKKFLKVLFPILLLVSLSACSKTLATTSDGKITENDYYKTIKNSPNNKKIFQQMVLSKVLDDKYGDKVSDKKVDNKYNAIKKKYGSSFNYRIEKKGYSKKSYKQQVRLSLLLQEAVKKHTKITNKDIEKQWKTYHPRVTVAAILLGNNDEGKKQAQNIIDSMNEDDSYKNFQSLAKDAKKDGQNSSRVFRFDNTNTRIAKPIMDTAFSLKEKTISSEPVKIDQGYAVIYSVKNPNKGKISEHKEDLKKQILYEKRHDSKFMKKIISKEVKDGKVNIKDDSLKKVLSEYDASNNN